MRKIIVTMLLVIGAVFLFGVSAVSAQTDIFAPPSGTPLTPENGAQISELARYGRGWINQITWSPDGQTLVVGSAVGVWVYDVNDLSAEPIVYGGHIEPVSSVAVSADGGFILAADEDGAAVMRDAETGETLFVDEVEFSTTRGLAFNPDGATFASGGGSGNVRVWNATAMSETPVELEGHGRTINVVRYSADGAWIASGADDNIVRIWDAATNTESVVLEGHTGSVRDLDMTSDAATLVSVSSDRFFRIWDTTTGAEQFVSEEFNGSIQAVDISPDDSVFVTGDDRGNLQSWDISGAPGWMVELPDDVKDLAFNPDGSLVAVTLGDQTIRIFDAAGGVEQQVILGHTYEAGGATINPDNSLISAGYNDDLARVWDLASGAEVWVNEGYGITDSNQLSVSFSPDGSVVATNEGFGVFLREPVTGEERAYFDTQSLSETFAFSPDSQLIAVGDWDGILQVYAVADGALLFEAKAHTGILNGISFSADGSLIVTAADDGAVRLWGIPG